MPIPYYKLYDRSFDDLVSDMLARIPGHTPEWTNPRLGDPGRTLIELFAWLADTLLYRVNLIPERQRLAFLRLLNIPMLPAQAAKGLIALELANNGLTKSIEVPLYTGVKGPIGFETCGEINVLPVQGQLYIKGRPTQEQLESLRGVISGLGSVYGLATTAPYITTPVFSNGQADEKGFDFVTESIDHCLWIALLAAKAEQVAQIYTALGRDSKGAKLLNIGLVPRLSMPTLFEEIGRESTLNSLWNWGITSSRVDSNGNPEYLSLDVVLDTTEGFRRQGIVRVELPDKEDIGLPENDVTKDVQAGVDSRPPRIDDTEITERLVTWIRLKPKHQVNSQAFSWVGVNAVEIDQRKTLTNVVIATATGIGDQEIKLPGPYVEPETLALQVEEAGQGYIDWYPVEDLGAASRDDRLYQLDPEAGILRFGDGVRGKVPEAGMRIRILRMRYGGGAQGNTAPGNIKDISHPSLKVTQPVATTGGADGESLEDAEKRIPAFLKHGDRAVTGEDYKRLALDTPAVELGRVEVLPKFKPHQFRKDVPGVVSIMVLPKSEAHMPPNPRPDRITLERVHSYLDERRPLATEMYIIGVEYIQIGLAIAVEIWDGQAHDQVLKEVRIGLRDYLWPLSPGGNQGTGWQLGRSVINQELEVEVARVEGVRIVKAVNLFIRSQGEWKKVNSNNKGLQEIKLESWQLPELLSVIVVDDEKDLPTDFAADRAAEEGEEVTGGTPIPVVPEVC